MTRTPFMLTTRRTVIGPWTPDDTPAFAAMATDPEMMRFITGGVPMSDAEQAGFMQRQAAQLEQHGVCMGAMLLRENQQVVGVAGLQYLDLEPALDIGWWVQPSHQRRGLATEAALALRNYAREHDSSLPLRACIHPANEGSRRVAARLGMVEVGCCFANQMASWRPATMVRVYGLPD